MTCSNNKIWTPIFVKKKTVHLTGMHTSAGDYCTSIASFVCVCVCIQTCEACARDSHNEHHFLTSQHDFFVDRFGYNFVIKLLLDEVELDMSVVVSMFLVWGLGRSGSAVGEVIWKWCLVFRFGIWEGRRGMNIWFIGRLLRFRFPSRTVGIHVINARMLQLPT